MTNPINNGGQAFPLTFTDPADQKTYGITGMTLRDYFAAAALTGLIEHSQTKKGRNHPEASTECLAKNAYAVADSMLKAREANPNA